MNQHPRRQPKKKNTTIAPPRQRRFAKVDIAYFTDEDENENPDWLVGAN